MRSLTGFFAAFCLAGLLAGCATGEKAVLRIGAGDEPNVGARHILFPPMSAGEMPRYTYVGQLVGEANFVTPEAQKDTLGGVLRWLVGLLVGENRPVILQRPQSGVVDEQGRILVTDVSRAAVFVFDQQKGELGLWEKAAGLQNFVSPVGIALGENGEVYVADSELGYVARLDRDGNTLGSIGKNFLQRPTGVAYDPVRRWLYVADTKASDIKVFTPAGELVEVFGAPGGETTVGLNMPTFLALHGDALYVTDTMNARVQVLSAETGTLLRRVSERGMNIGNLVRPKGVAVDSEGNIYVVESYYDHLLVYNAKGQFLMPIGGGAGQSVGQYFLPSGVWVDARDRVFMADTFNGRVVVFQYLGGGAENGQ